MFGGSSGFYAFGRDIASGVRVAVQGDRRGGDAGHLADQSAARGAADGGGRSLWAIPSASSAAWISAAAKDRASPGWMSAVTAGSALSSGHKAIWTAMRCCLFALALCASVAPSGGRAQIG